MRISILQRLRRNAGFNRTKLSLKRVTGKEPWLREEVEIPTAQSDDWTYCPDLLKPSSVVFSLGVGCDIAFDMHMIDQFGAEVHAFDPTPSTVDWLKLQSVPATFHFYPWAVGSRDHTMRLRPRRKKNGTQSNIMFHQVPDDAIAGEHDISVEAKCLSTILRELDCASIDLLKMDIEGAEYEVFADLMKTSIRPTQILVEFHHRHAGLNKSMTTDAVNSLRHAGYAIFSISATGREFSFVYKDAIEHNQVSS